VLRIHQKLTSRAEQIRRTLSLASLDTLLLISADQRHRDRFIAGVSRAGKDLVWRDKDEDKLYPRDYERALVLAAKRGLRESTPSDSGRRGAEEAGSFFLAFSVRSGVNVLLLIFRSFRKKRLRMIVLLRALFGAEPFRFGAMIGGLSRWHEDVELTRRHIHIPQHTCPTSFPPDTAVVLLPPSMEVWYMEYARLWPADTRRRRRGAKMAGRGCWSHRESGPALGDSWQKDRRGAAVRREPWSSRS
jgi:hypothetical protein